MNTPCWALLSVATLALTGVVWNRTPEQTAGCLGTLTPAYLQADGIQALTDGAHGPLLLILNPHSGPGQSASGAYRRAVERAQAGGTRVLGYVATTFGARPAADIEADAGRYRDWYGIDGIFLDEVAGDTDSLAYYRALSRSIDGLLVLNPGTVPAREYFALADMVVTFEGPFSAYAATLAKEPGWLREIPPAKIAHLVYAASRPQAVSLFAGPARSGSLYVTSGVLPDPWGAPPPYLREEQAARSSNCPAPS